MIITPENLIENLHTLGPWSLFGLTEEAMFHYHPELQSIQDVTSRLDKMLSLSRGMTWKDWIVKYDKEIGYHAPNGFNPMAVNEF
jgi:hypothetical protein